MTTILVLVAIGTFLIACRQLGLLRVAAETGAIGSASLGILRSADAGDDIKERAARAAARQLLVQAMRLALLTSASVLIPSALLFGIVVTGHASWNEIARTFVSYPVIAASVLMAGTAMLFR